MSALLHDTEYLVEQDDTPLTVSTNKFSGLAMNVGDDNNLTVNKNITVHMPCGCSSSASYGVLSYAVQKGDTLSNIASLFRSSSQDILNLNPSLTNPDFIKPGWILFIPMGVAGSSKKKVRSLSIIVAASISAAVLLLCLFTIIIQLKRKSSHHNVEAPEIKMDRVPSNTSIAALESRFFPSMRINDIDPFQTERPVIFSLKAIGDAAANFDEKRKIGEGGYGSVYFGVVGTHVINLSHGLQEHK